ncbi:MFS transporter [Phenylobacterium sp.]|uniref:MFS transporter n=1 Tax=Phenylobacterium sp. TaxID=1871053 RepID=UPI0025E8B7FC|nr:MFS transporter [Phenylobacterium sp.]
MESTSLEAHGVSAPLDGPVIAELGGDGKLNRGAIAWAIFEGGRDPYVILITIYIFLPYVSSVLVGDPIRGQEVVSRYAQILGWTVMATAPFLGASIDKLGRRKILLGVIVGLMVPIIGAMWFAKPGGVLSVPVIMGLWAAATLLFNYSEVLHNSLLVRAAGLRGAHKASGLALALGNAASVVMLAFTAWAFALPGKVPWSWVPHAPLFGLDPATAEPQRVVALIAAGSLALGAIPLFLFTPDAPSTGVPLLSAVRSGVADLIAMIRTVRRYKDAVVYLVSRMFFVDGMNAILVYAGVYATGVMKWGPLEMLTYGILLSITAAIGGLAARGLDAALGPKNALRLQITMAILGNLALLGMTPTRILYLWSFDPHAHPAMWAGPVFRTLPEWVFILIGFSNSIFISGQYASSRTILTRLTPPAQAGAFFGVYALAGVATSWLAPTLVNWGTQATHSQQGGFAMIPVLLTVGLVGLAFVKGGGREP